MPQRRCLGCGRVREKKSLVRFVVREGKLTPDTIIGGGIKGVLGGRGAYLCPDRGCVSSACKMKNVFSRALKSVVKAPDEEELWGYINKGKVI